MPVHIQNGVVVIELTKDLDVVAAEGLEQCYLDLLDRGARFFVIGFDNANLITSDGIRVVLELTRKVSSRDGAVVLYGIGQRVRTILNITRLIDQFQIAASLEEAMAAVTARASRIAAPPRSLLTRVVGHVLLPEPAAKAGQTADEGAALGSESALSSEVAALFARAWSDSAG